MLNDVMKMAQKKRFAPTLNCDTISDESNETLMVETNVDQRQESDDNEKIEMLRKAEMLRKRQAETTKKNKERNEELILQRYLDDNANDFELEFNELQAEATSTPLRTPTNKSDQSDKNTIRQQAIRIKHLESQLKRCRKDIADVNKDYEERVNDSQNRSNTSDKACCSAFDHFKVHDKMFSFTKEQAQQELEYNEEGNVHLGSQVYCNPVAFNDAFKSKKPFQCLSLLSEGVYGLDELSKRCVRKQANTKNCKLLSPTKRLVIERKVYAFMRMKDLTLSQIDDFLDSINAYHRKVINGAKSRLVYLRNQKEKEKEIEEVVQNFNEQQEN